MKIVLSKTSGKKTNRIFEFIFIPTMGVYYDKKVFDIFIVFLMWQIDFVWNNAEAHTDLH